VTTPHRDTPTTAFPGIVVRNGPAGMRARLVNGHDVWEVIETFLDEDRNVEAAARYLNLPLDVVREAVSYYAAHIEEIDDLISRNTAMAEQVEAAWRSRSVH
jgi:uncharacterized protein (DUF433 family)